MPLTILIALAGLMGASGVMLAAAGAHGTPRAGLDGAAYMLLFHAAAILGGAALAHQGVLSRPLIFVALIGWVVGASLFAGDIALRTFAGHRLFPMAAPTGGIILIAAWFALAAAAVAVLRRRPAVRNVPRGEGSFAPQGDAGVRPHTCATAYIVNEVSGLARCRRHSASAVSRSASSISPSLSAAARSDSTVDGR